ncbi:hypothetical protein AURDEDRAFT_159457 [Auricularia subglabra TFB-10046 SS5]|nr:hypothetical protein AURDEDRAFT_159457 [Auricularia subglabra TFB-10046 SS5]
MNSTDAALLKAKLPELIPILSDVNASRYTSLAALVLFLCDTIHNLSGDITYILPSSPKAVVFGYFINRLFAFICMLVVNYALSTFSGPLNDEVIVSGMTSSKSVVDSPFSCQVLLGADLTLGVISIGLTDALVTFEVWRLWDRNAVAGRILVTAFFATSAAALVIMLTVDITFLNHARYEPLVKACVVTPAPRNLIAALYASGLLFEVAVFASTLINVLHKPRSSHTTIATVLYRDGCIYFVAVSGLRLANTLVSIVSRESADYVVNHLIWALVLILLNRLVRNQCKGRIAEAEERRQAADGEIAVARDADVELDVLSYYKKN